MNLVNEIRISPKVHSRNFQQISANSSDINYDVSNFSNTLNYDSFSSVELSKFYSIGAWNLNGWKSLKNPDNQQFKRDIIRILNLDIYLFSETHCQNKESISIDGYKVFSYNREKMSHKSLKGSGGVAIAINNRLLSSHKILSVFYG